MATASYTSMLSLGDVYFYTRHGHGMDAVYSYRLQWSTKVLTDCVNNFRAPDINEYRDDEEDYIDSEYYDHLTYDDYIRNNKNDGTDQADSFKVRIYYKYDGTLAKEITTSEQSVDVVLENDDYLWEVVALKNGVELKTSAKSWLYAAGEHLESPWELEAVTEDSTFKHMLYSECTDGWYHSGRINTEGYGTARFLVTGESYKEGYESALEGGYTFSPSANMGDMGDEYKFSDNCFFTKAGIYVLNNGRWDYFAYNVAAERTSRQKGDYFTLNEDYVNSSALKNIYSYNAQTGNIERVVQAAAPVLDLSADGKYYLTEKGVYETATNKLLFSITANEGEYALLDGYLLNLYCLKNGKKVHSLAEDEAGSLVAAYYALGGSKPGSCQTATLFSKTKKQDFEIDVCDILELAQENTAVFQIVQEDTMTTTVIVHTVTSGGVQKITKTYSCMWPNLSFDENGDLQIEYWGEEDTLAVGLQNPLTPDFLFADQNGLSWKHEDAETTHIVTIGNKNQPGKIKLMVDDALGVDFHGIQAGTYDWTLQEEGDSSVECSTFVVNAPLQQLPVVQRGTWDSTVNLFFAHADGVWGSGYAAEYQGDPARDISEAQVLLQGKNRITDIFDGQNSAEDILVLTDDANGDALFIDDIYSAYPAECLESESTKKRLDYISEIRAGAGDDVIDLTSRNVMFDGFEMTIRGGDGNDVIWASHMSMDNDLFGDDGNDRIIGSAGFDLIVGGAGDDYMQSGGGNGIFAFGANWGNDTVVVNDPASTCILWFESGSMSKWDDDNRIYRDGSNSVTVLGEGNVNLYFGNDRNAEPGQYDDLVECGAFEAKTSEKIFETNSNLLA